MSCIRVSQVLGDKGRLRLVVICLESMLFSNKSCICGWIVFSWVTSVEENLQHWYDRKKPFSYLALFMFWEFWKARNRSTFKNQAQHAEVICSNIIFFFLNGTKKSLQEISIFLYFSSIVFQSILLVFLMEKQWKVYVVLEWF